jgi:hypothetical protein
MSPLWITERLRWNDLNPLWYQLKDHSDQRGVNGSLKFLSKLWSLAWQTTPKANSHESYEIHVLTWSKIPHVKSWAHWRSLERRWKQTHEATEENSTFCALPDCSDWGNRLFIGLSSDYRGHLSDFLAATAGPTTETDLGTVNSGRLSSSRGRTVCSSSSRKQIESN